MFRVSVFLFICTLFCSCVWNDTERNPDFLVLDDSEYPYAGLPRLVIETEDFAQIGDRETEHSAKLQIYGENSPESDVLDLEIKGRGNSSFSMAKYSIKLKFENKQPLFGMPKDKEWDLVANHRDKSMLRNYITYQLAHTLHDSYSPRNQFVEVFLNRRYMGVYMLVEHIKVSPQRVKIYEDDSSYLFEKTSANATGENLITTDMDFNYDICYPKNPTTQIKETLYEYAVGEPATLGALPAVRAPAAKVLASEALPRIAYAERPVYKNFEFERCRTLDGCNLLCREFSCKDRTVEPEFRGEVYGLRAGKRHLRARMNFLRRRDGAYKPCKPDILNDESIRFQSDEAFQKFGQLLHFAFEYEYVHRKEGPYPAHPCVADHLADAFERKVLGATTRIPVRHAEVHCVGAVV